MEEHEAVGADELILVCDVCKTARQSLGYFKIAGLSDVERWSFATGPAASKGWAIRKAANGQRAICPACLVRVGDDAIHRFEYQVARLRTLLLGCTDGIGEAHCDELAASAADLGFGHAPVEHGFHPFFLGGSRPVRWLRIRHPLSIGDSVEVTTYPCGKSTDENMATRHVSDPVALTRLLDAWTGEIEQLKQKLAVAGNGIRTTTGPAAAPVVPRVPDSEMARAARRVPDGQSSLRTSLSRVWNDPVWSKVIAAGLLALWVWLSHG